MGADSREHGAWAGRLRFIRAGRTRSCRSVPIAGGLATTSRSSRPAIGCAWRACAPSSPRRKTRSTSTELGGSKDRAGPRELRGLHPGLDAEPGLRLAAPRNPPSRASSWRQGDPVVHRKSERRIARSSEARRATRRSARGRGVARVHLEGGSVAAFRHARCPDVARRISERRLLDGHGTRPVSTRRARVGSDLRVRGVPRSGRTPSARGADFRRSSSSSSAWRAVGTSASSRGHCASS